MESLDTTYIQTHSVCSKKSKQCNICLAPKMKKIIEFFLPLLESDMFLPKVQIVLFWRATRCGLAKNCSKTQKITVKYWSFGDFWPKNAQKRQKTEVADFGATKLHYFTVIFCLFEQFSAKPHLVARQNRTIWTFGKNMSGPEPF